MVHVPEDVPTSMSMCYTQIVLGELGEREHAIGKG